MGNNQTLLLVVCGLLFAFGAMVGCQGSTGSETVATDSPKTAPKVQDVIDITNLRCMPCHATGKPKEDLALDSVAGLIKGSEDGPVYVAGNAAESLIIQRVRASRGKKIMPPKGSPLTEEQIETIEAWINAGAKTE